jgi:hypothetical protein
VRGPRPPHSDSRGSNPWRRRSVCRTRAARRAARPG